MDKEVENFIHEYIAYQANTKLPNPTPFNISELPKEPWLDILCDFFWAFSLWRFVTCYCRFIFVISTRRGDKNYKRCCIN